ncbi:RiPP maturation radical SAM C-methyltransferase [Acetobacter senegalensis]|uniref:RiPP maturation radical SAM C-methyltransferase n=1 Tax=Acetobacter senegalensis TaxID=446692 RepID=UPI001EDA0E59|nr:RiPP maturation radical SAM C-methyltransferase [Acetobacter senegalensis]MCG4262262.1 RiPP maturation radical SAM C-methyltransferase [Acetobacter senegalensis]
MTLQFLNKKIMLVVPPISSVTRPSLGVSNLKSAAQRAGFDVRIFYACFDYAEWIGVDLNQKLAEGTRSDLLIGEWIFCDNIRTQPITGKYLNYENDVLVPHEDEHFLDTIRALKDGSEDYVERCAEIILAQEPAIVGISSTFHQHCAALSIAKKIKERRSDIIILLGGANCEEEMGRATADLFPWIDYVFSGESEVTFPHFLNLVSQAVERGTLDVERDLADSKLGRKFWDYTMAPPLAQMDDLPIPAFDEYFARLSKSTFRHRVQPALTFESSRGCWWGQKHHCTFCGLNGHTMSFRAKSAGRVLSEIKYLSDTWSIHDFAASDNIIAMHHIQQVFDKIPDNSKDRFFYETKANVSEDQLRRLCRAGVTWIQPGVENLSDRVLKIMEKGVSGALNVRLLRLCAEIGLVPTWNYLVGFPGEEDADYVEALDLIPALTHLRPPGGAPAQLRVDRFSPYFTGKAKDLFDVVRPSKSYSYIYEFNDDAISRLAYFFDGFSSRIISGDMLKKLSNAIDRWQREYWSTGPVLAGVRIADGMIVRDTRGIATEEVFLLGPDEVALVDSLRNPKTFDFSNRSSFEEKGVSAECLQSLLDRNVVVKIGQQYLSLITDESRRLRTRAELADQPAGYLLSATTRTEAQAEAIA